MQNFCPLSRRVCLVVWAVTLVCLGLAPYATQAATAQADAAAPTHAHELATGLGEVAPGLWIFLDPETGLITDRPSPEQAAALRAQVSSLVNESTAGLVGRTYADGSKSLDLRGRFQSVSILSLTPSGEPKVTCAETTDEALGALLPGVRPTPTLDGLETE